MAETTRQEARVVAGEVSTQAGRVMSDTRQHLRGVADEQQTAAVKRLRQAADELQEMAQGRSESPAQSMVAGLAERGQRLADHLEARGPQGVLNDIQAFARRRPGTFLLAALGAGFAAGRLGRNVMTAPNGPMSSDAARSGTTSGASASTASASPAPGPAPTPDPSMSSPESTTYRSAAAPPERPASGGLP